jgi:hypothetical protein
MTLYKSPGLVQPQEAERVEHEPLLCLGADAKVILTPLVFSV